jgi:hypothetical protein
MAFNRGPKIVTQGLVLALDAASKNSYVSGSTTWTDLSGNNNNATLVNGPTFSSANGGSIVFDGTDDYVAFTYNSNVAFLSASSYTLEVFALPQSSSAGYPGIINRESNPGSGRDGYNLLHTQVEIPAGQVFIMTERWATNSGVQCGFLTQTSSFYDKWHHIVGTYNGTNLSIYYDGVLQTSTVSTGNITNTTKALEVATRSGDDYKGNIPITRIYNRALSAAEIQQNYNATKSRFDL